MDVEIRDLPPGCLPSPGSQKLWALYRLGETPARIGFTWWADRLAEASQAARRRAACDPTQKYLLMAIIAPVQNGCIMQKR